MTDRVCDDFQSDNELYSDGDVDTNRSGNPSLTRMINRRLSRRAAFRSGAKATGVAVFSSSLLAACTGEESGSNTVAGLSTNGAGMTTMTVSAGQMVSLAPVAGANIASASFTQAAGPEVSFLATEGAPDSFIAPAVREPTRIQVNVRGGDGGGQSSDDGGSTGGDNPGTVPAEIIVNPAELSFPIVAKNFDDVVTVPEGYSVKVMTRLGDPILPGAAEYANDGTDTDFAKRIGDHGDALYYFGLNADGTPNPRSSGRGLLAQNHENLNVQYLHPNGPSPEPRPASEAIKEIEAHGVSITEYVDQGDRNWTFFADSPFNRRITPNTPVQFNGPLRGSEFLFTKFSNDGKDGRGTINNCANGVTEWGTLLTCEENWAGYFLRSGDDANRTAKELVALNRYGVSRSRSNYSWTTATPTDEVFARWDANATSGEPTNDFRNEPNQFGWVVEIDPYDPSQKPRKRTALGRFAHEGAWLGKVTDGKRLAVYMGDDSRNEYFYKFISARPWNSDTSRFNRPLSIGDRYLDKGTLCVAKFNEDGTGEWVPLVFGEVPDLPDYAFENQQDVLCHPRLAGDAVGATTMDRPEWTACNPVTGEVYLTLTNNRASSRPIEEVNAANPRYYIDPPETRSSRYGNPNGHIIRIREGGNDPAALNFIWDIYLFGADSNDPDQPGVDRNISGLTDDNDFSSPDGLWFARPSNAGGQIRPLAWVQTDDSSMDDRTNDQMLAALPGAVGDGASMTVNGRNADGVASAQTSVVGAPVDNTVLRRFLVGPNECEITGVDSTPDGRTLFVGIQHPGERGDPSNITSNWPQSQSGDATGRPRSAVVAITKDDGGIVGL